MATAAIALGARVLVFGNLDAQRDWGHAKDYVARRILNKRFQRIT
jgi:GDP-D-mannose dehydratase